MWSARRSAIPAGTAEFHSVWPTVFTSAKQRVTRTWDPERKPWKEFGMIYDVKELDNGRNRKMGSGRRKEVNLRAPELNLPRTEK